MFSILPLLAFSCYSGGVMENTEKTCYSVSEITFLIKGLLERSFGTVKVEGEISNFRPSSTGHLYFTLKDDNAIISAVMFRNRIGGLTFEPADGKTVIVEGNISVYPKRGNYQIICESMQPVGEGNILAMLEERKKRLAEEGLFEEERKKPLPLFPSKVAVITSPTGAALRDILRVLRRRSSGLNLVILPAPVQGEEAAHKIARGIRTANIHKLGEVIIVGRGGGSLEDLLPFSDEEVVRAIADSEIPVISAVGHEIDISLSDLAADVRAPTPSAAAEIVTTSREELFKRVGELKNNLVRTIEQKRERVSLLLNQFRTEQLQRHFQFIYQPLMVRLDDAKEVLLNRLTTVLTNKKHRVELLSNRLEANSPQQILKKGYAVVTDTQTGLLISSAGRTSPGKEIDVTFEQSRLTALVENVEDPKA